MNERKKKSIQETGSFSLVFEFIRKTLSAMEGVFQQERSVTSCLVELVETCKPVDHTAPASVCYGFIRFANQKINRKELVAVRIY